MHDQDLNHKLRLCLVEGLEPLLKKFRGNSLLDLFQDMKDMFVNKYKKSYLWSRPLDYHVTVLYMNRDEEVADESKIY